MAHTVAAGAAERIAPALPAAAHRLSPRASTVAAPGVAEREVAVVATLVVPPAAVAREPEAAAMTAAVAAVARAVAPLFAGAFRPLPLISRAPRNRGSLF